MHGTRYRSRSSSNTNNKSKIHPLDRKIKPNPRYIDIEPSINTGYNVRKQIEKMEEIRQYYKFRPDEIFRRITVTSLVRLMLEVAKLEIQLDEESEILNSRNENESILESTNVGEDDCQSTMSGSDHGSNESDRETVSSVIYSGKRIPIRNVESSKVADILSNIDISSDEGRGGSDDLSDGKYPFPNRPYLLLDVREHELQLQTTFEAIRTSENYPHSRLSRAFNFESQSMLHFKNVPGKIIVLYDLDESIASKVATILIQRGYENIFMLSGGLKVASIKFPEKLIGPYEPHKGLLEDDIEVIEEFLEEAIARGNSSRLSSYNPSSLSSSRMSRASSIRTSRSFQDLTSTGAGTSHKFRKNAPSIRR